MQWTSYVLKKGDYRVFHMSKIGKDFRYTAKLRKNKVNDFCLLFVFFHFHLETKLNMHTIKSVIYFWKSELNCYSYLSPYILSPFFE
jgi:hypothetical protein